jgi:glycyl-tRNA synthetase
MEDLVSLCKRRGFIFQSADIYGGLKGIYDYGPLGVELKNNIKAAWWRTMVYERDDVEGLDAATIAHYDMFYYSGHVEGFHDPLIECKKCQARLRQDKMADPTKCDNCGSTDLSEPREFNLLFPVTMGPVAERGTKAFLRGETCQHIFANFKNIMDSTNRRPPFGIAQIGRAYRNEIVARNFIFRTREFEQLELEYFVKPGTDETWYDHWVAQSMAFWESLGLPPQALQQNVLAADDLPHYAKKTIDVEFNFPHGFDEIESINNRTDYDLGNHTKAQKDYDLTADVKENKDSNTKMAVQDVETGSWYIPYVVEASMGLDRALLAVLTQAYTEEQLEGGKSRIVLKLKPQLAPIKAAVIPLAKNKPELVQKAKEIKDHLQKLGLGRILLENTGNVGKAYRRHDEVGTPLCITIDHDSLEDNCVTLRDRDTMTQERVPVADVAAHLQDLLIAQ